MTRHRGPLRFASVLLLALSLLLSACATIPDAHGAGQKLDPWENWNRKVFAFNEGLDEKVLKPVATAYRDVTPAPVRRGVTNFFGNIADVWSTVNNLLQGKPTETMESLFRVTTNTVWGIGGLFDVASDLHITKHSEDFGQTLGYWGVPSGPYVVLPILGPSTARDSGALLVDYQGDLVSQADNVRLRNSLTGLRAVNLRASVLNAGEVLDQAALDKYSFTRDVYLQRRQSLIRDKPPEEEERFDLPEGATGASGAAPSPATAPAQ